VAVVGTVGRGTAWPCSDVDLLALVDESSGIDAEALLIEEEDERNASLYRRGVINPTEIRHWLFTAEHVCRAIEADDNAFYRSLEHQHWLGTVLKAQGGRVLHDPDGSLARFIARLERVFATERFRQLWLRKYVSYCQEALRAAAAHADAGRWAAASSETLRIARQRLPCTAYAMWHRLPESGSRAVSRFLSAAAEEGDAETAESYLIAARLEADAVAERFASVPPAGKKERNVVSAIRRASGEAIDELSVTRDFLNVLLWRPVVRDHGDGPRPAWTGVTDDADQVRRQLEAIRSLVARFSGELTDCPADT